MSQPRETRLELTAAFETVENDWIQARILEFPGVITVAPSQAEARELLVDALREYLLSFGSNEPAPEADDLAREHFDLVIEAQAS